MIVAPPPAALAVSPARLAIPAGASTAVEIRNPGGARTVVLSEAAAYAIDAGGRPREVARRRDRVRLLVRPAKVAVAAGGTTRIVVAARVERGARPGDHAELLVLTTRPVARGGVGVRLRIGVPVVVRVAGVVVHRLTVARSLLRPRRAPSLGVVVRNRGNVVERLAGRRLEVQLVQAGRLVATLRASARDVLPGARATFRFRWPSRVLGRVHVVVRVDGVGVAAWSAARSSRPRQMRSGCRSERC